jgi:hypothetical protein
MENIARPRLTLLTNDQIEAVHEASLTILAKSGLRVDSERARKVYASGGARLEGDRVYIHRDLVDAAIEFAPATIDISTGRTAGVRLGDGETRFGASPALYQDPATDELAPSPVAHGAGCASARRSELRRIRPSGADLPRRWPTFTVLEMVAN